jgi:hypothetical protein
MARTADWLAGDDCGSVWDNNASIIDDAYMAVVTSKGCKIESCMPFLRILALPHACMRMSSIICQITFQFSRYAIATHQYHKRSRCKKYARMY